MPARSFARRAAAWDLTALLNAADPKASRAERQLWLVRLLEWLRHAPLDKSGNAGTGGTGGDEPRSTPTPVLRLKHLLGVLDRNAEHRARVAELLHRLWREIDSAALLADFGFAPRTRRTSSPHRCMRGAKPKSASWCAACAPACCP